jgi:hypothetical protein
MRALCFVNIPIIYFTNCPIKFKHKRVRQSKEKALRRLRHRSRREPLRKYLG